MIINFFFSTISTIKKSDLVNCLCLCLYVALSLCLSQPLSSCLIFFFLTFFLPQSAINLLFQYYLGFIIRCNCNVSMFCKVIFSHKLDLYWTNCSIIALNVLYPWKKDLGLFCQTIVREKI